MIDSFSNLWQRFGKISEAAEFIFVAYLAPTLVIAVLLPLACVTTGSLNMASRGWTNPNDSPCRRNGQPFDSKNPLLGAGSVALCVELLEGVDLDPGCV